MRTVTTYLDKSNNKTTKEKAWTIMTQVYNDAGNLQRTGYSAGEAQIKAAQATADTAALDIRDETDGKNWRFTKNIVRAGRDNACDIVFDQKEDKKKIDKIHAVFELRQNIWHVVDMSKTGIRLNGEKIPSGIPKALKAGDEVELGQRRKLRIN